MHPPFLPVFCVQNNTQEWKTSEKQGRLGNEANEVTHACDKILLIEMNMQVESTRLIVGFMGWS